MSLPILLSMDDLKISIELITAQENTHRNMITGLKDLTDDTIRPILVKWGVLGFPKDYILHSLQISTPSKCSDGVHRTFYEYIDYLVPSLAGCVQELDDRLPGMKLGFSFDENVIHIHVQSDLSETG